MSDTQDVEALVASESGIHSPLNACCHRETCRTLARERDEANAAREGYYATATLLIEKAESRASSLEAQLAGAKEALEKAHQFCVCAIAFLGRDRGTSRIEGTLDGISKLAVELDPKLREALASAPASTPVVPHEQATGETQAGLLLMDEMKADESLRDRLRAAVIEGCADELNGGPNGNIITKGCEAAEYIDPEDATGAFVDGIVDNILAAITPSEGRDGKEVA